MTDWQPIETAPKDGTVIDLWMVDEAGEGKRIPNAYWVENYSDSWTVYAEDGSHKTEWIKRDGWFAPGFDYDGQDGFCDYPKRYNAHPRQQKWIWSLPTHWMPLPAPPPD